MNKDELIKKWLADELSNEELKAFKETDDFKEIEKIDKHLGHFKASDYDTDNEKSKLKSSVNQQRSTFLSLPSILKIAASVIILSGVAFYFLTPSDNIRTISSSNLSEFYLPDSSYLKLNTGSIISYLPEKWNQTRSVKLDGEVYFKVRSGSTFSVETTHGVVSVLGTAFNVKSRDGFFEITCYEGQVRLENTSINSVLNKGELVQIIDNKISESTIDEAQPSWLNGKSSFKSTPLKLVLKEFEREYMIKIQAQNIPNEKLFSGSFVHDDLDLALKSIAIPMNLSYEIEEGQVILSGDSNH
ncbi:FecR family protein [Ekhidna sp.]|uniref:FecR family protein n=1 Tax=Ekhidna sp. TaxID=2608089 RepID=UPI0032986D03